jgi:hypothetical protein
LDEDVLSLDVPVSDVLVIKDAGCVDNVLKDGQSFELRKTTVSTDEFFECAE